jgi:hypothetical protein
MAEQIITQEYLHSIFEYKDGELFAKTNRGNNKIKKGEKCGVIKSNNYLSIGIGYEEYLVHRIIFMMFYGYFPKYVDHMDGNSRNNKIDNLRECTNQQNSFNQKLRKNNSSGIKGVSWDNYRQKWSAKCQLNRKTIFLGRFKTIEEAEKIVKLEREKLHGAFARHY